ncbi:hypothetical protein KTC96_24670 (plasmid) [Clostridium estertheticum]|uniref:hypothetical protein n=1 Tax=Clostridium estertheticum TaxID=238834 RepID=UPI001C7D473C|nr:hypothetical protein [Clostridium estertheticum]MBX4259722.1 hypothetical protein [Clostridium estertheticum]WLC73309.1 hypothetical protein KTC96_24670 [Clostridium estertheticum]
MIYIEYNADGMVSTQHFMPFDKFNGIKNADGNISTEAELNAKGLLVESIPQMKIEEGKNGALYINISTKELFYKFTDVPKTEVEILRDQIALMNARVNQKEIDDQTFQDYTLSKLPQ